MLLTLKQKATWTDSDLNTKKSGKFQKALSFASTLIPRLTVWDFVSAGALAVLYLLLTNQMDVAVILSGEVYELLTRIGI
jgi:hypothetical protein